MLDVLNKRTSASVYDSSHALKKDDIIALVHSATLAPSAFNLQNWRFIAVQSEAGKAKLLPIAYGQQKVVDSAVTFIICGTLEPHLGLPAALKPAVEAGILDEATFAGWVGAAEAMYGSNPRFQRDEAIRSGSLAAMTLMLAAQEMGLASTPMIGFNADELSAAFNLGATDVPVMLVTVGKAGAGNWPQKPRKAVLEVLSFA
ncbi:Nitroreductase [Pseudoxanthomonas sp. GM95]|uniref:nitroreductase family protein n=1 Tax=Pseudoxanthomonas sp. GM95 TaxID=1881043 RepID=UPI0008D0434C|nr:nitroreductase family protein [Pseudoxanthomonas sp. GM95]SEM54321.1 Nitroreductase [Pseudoxanthomonas sp. GM95]